MSQNRLRSPQKHPTTPHYPPSTPSPSARLRSILPCSLPVLPTDWDTLSRSVCINTPPFPPSLKAGRDALGRPLSNLPLGEPLPIPAPFNNSNLIHSPCRRYAITTRAHWVFLNSTHPFLLSLNLADLVASLSDRTHPNYSTLRHLGFTLVLCLFDDEPDLMIDIYPIPNTYHVTGLSTGLDVDDVDTDLFDYFFNLNNPYFKQDPNDQHDDDLSVSEEDADLLTDLQNQVNDDPDEEWGGSL